MLGRCPRCGGSRPLTAEQEPVPCAGCGFTHLVASNKPPAPSLAEPLWLPAVLTCIGVSFVVFVLALLSARAINARAAPPSGSRAKVVNTSSPSKVKARERVTQQADARSAQTQ